MADKQFIGKVSEKVFNNGGTIIRLSLGDKDKEMIARSTGYFNIAIKKSSKGNWYAEVDTYQQTQPVQNNSYSRKEDQTGDLPF